MRKYFATYAPGSGVIDMSGRIPRPAEFARNNLPADRRIYIGVVNVSAETHFIGVDGRPVALDSGVENLSPADLERKGMAKVHREKFTGVRSRRMKSNEENQREALARRIAEKEAEAGNGR